MKKSSSKIKSPPSRNRGTKDLVRLYLQDIGKVDLLNSEDEVILARLVQRREALLKEEKKLASQRQEIKELMHLEQLQQQKAVK